MSNPIVERYKIPFLLSIVVSLAIIILPGTVNYQTVILAFAGSFLGILLIDLEYVVHAYLVDPSSEVSVRIKEYLSARDYAGLIDFYNREEYSFGELSIRSILFQGILAMLALMTITNQSWIFARGMVLSMSISLLYFQFQEYLRTSTLQRWFWVYRGSLYPAIYKAYMTVIFLIFIYQFTFL